MDLPTLLPFIVVLVIGGIAGFAFGAMLTKRRHQTELLELTSRLAASEAESTERQAAAEALITNLKEFKERSQRELADSFKALAADALGGTSKQFLNLAEQRLATTEERSKAELEKRQEAIKNLLSPLQESLKSLDDRTQQIEKARIDAYSRIDEQVQQLAKATSTLHQETTTLATALRSSQVRGRWGEIALRNVAELAGMVEHCDFEEQVEVGNGQRPDMTVKLPGGRKIAVDAKAPLTDYLAATEASEETAREAALDRHVKALKGHIKTLAGRDYAAALQSDLDLVVLFLPGDPFLSAAFAKDPELQVEALRSKVLIATPTTLVALLRTVAIYWQQRTMAESAEAIAESARELYQRAAKFSDELGSVGKGLKSALDAYNRAVGSFDRRLIPMGRRLEELKISEQVKRDLEAPEPIDEEPRQVSS